MNTPGPYENVFSVGAATDWPPFVADEVIAAFQTYLQAFDGYRSAVELQSDTMRVPIAANSGCSGSGKTTHLRRESYRRVIGQGMDRDTAWAMLASHSS
jgi:hypothetical protein